MDGLPFRKLGDEHGLSGKQVFLKVRKEISALPQNFNLTRSLCDMNRFSRFLVIDGKYISVKGFEQKIPFLYGIDYLTHDIPHGDLFVAEDEMAFSQFFGKLKDLGYSPQVVIADDRAGLKQALNKVFPYARLQLCHTHYLENIRQLLRVRTEERYRHFFNSLSLHVFKQDIDEYTIEAGWRHVWKERTGGNWQLQNILKEIDRRKTDLFNYLQIKNCPNTTNIIESYNSHLQGRLDTIKGFQSFDSAKAWCNGYLIRRRTKTFTDCEFPFKHLNGFASLQFTIRDFKLWPTWIAGVQKPRKEPKR